MTPPDKKLERLYQRLAALRQYANSQAIIDVSDEISAFKREMRAK